MVLIFSAAEQCGRLHSSGHHPRWARDPTVAVCRPARRPAV